MGVVEEKFGSQKTKEAEGVIRRRVGQGYKDYISEKGKGKG